MYPSVAVAVAVAVGGARVSCACRLARGARLARRHWLGPVQWLLRAVTFLRMVAAGVGAPDSRVDELLDKVGLTATAGARLSISSELARDGMDEAPRLARWQCDLFHPFKASAIFVNVSLRHRDDAVRLLVRDQHPHHNDCDLATLCDTRKRGPVRSRSGPRCAIGNVLRSSAG